MNRSKNILVLSILIAHAMLQSAFTSATEIWLAEAKFKLTDLWELTSQLQPYNSSKTSLSIGVGRRGRRGALKLQPTVPLDHP